MVQSFSEAVSDFQRFLNSEGRPTSIQWVFREDVLAFSGTLNIRRNLRSNQRLEAESLFEYGRRRGLGVSFEALESDTSTTYAYVVVPEDETDAEYRLMGGTHIKLAVPAERRASIRRIGNIKWTLLRLRRRLSAHLGYEAVLPSRQTSLPALPNSA